MRNNVKNALKETLQDLVSSGVKTSFSEKELKKIGVVFKSVKITPEKIKRIREKTKLSQSVFASLLNVSPSSIRQWEQGLKRPTGSAQVLLELIEKEPHILDYRISLKPAGKSREAGRQ